jgi:TatD DNase family protein
MIDIHCHLNFHKFEHDFDEVIKRAQEKGVSKIVNVGTSIDTSKWAVKLAEKYEDLYAIVGVHPHHADKIELGTNWID